MSTLVYWKLNRLDDHNAYSLRFRTKQEAVRAYASILQSGTVTIDGHTHDVTHCKYGEPVKVVVSYTGGVFGAVCRMMEEDCPDWN